MKKSNLKALILLILPFIFILVLILSLNKDGITYWIGQLLGSLFFIQCFILLHEAGHYSFFKSKRLNITLGYLVSIPTLIPYYNWRKIHNLHHRWAGLRRKDPTTEKTFGDQLTGSQIKLINLCWKYYIPLFTAGYRFGTYWDKDKLKRHLSEGEYQRSLKEMRIYSLGYLIITLVFFKTILLLLPAILFSWIGTDILTLSQHAHIAMNDTFDKAVKPFNYKEQANFSRSLIFPKLISYYLLYNFNFHEAHHSYPGLPCYYLQKIKVSSKNAYPITSWLKKVKSMEGVKFIFSSSQDRKGF